MKRILYDYFNLLYKYLDILCNLSKTSAYNTVMFEEGVVKNIK